MRARLAVLSPHVPASPHIALKMSRGQVRSSPHPYLVLTSSSLSTHRILIILTSIPPHLVTDAARVLLQEWTKADEQARAGRRDLKNTLAANNDVCVAAAVSEAQRRRRRLAHRQVCVKLVEALNADALAALQRMERERAVRLLL